jgi:hypothetical protein
MSTKPIIVPGNDRYWDSPVKADYSVRLVGEDEYRAVPPIAGLNAVLGPNLLFAGIQSMNDVEVLEVSIQNQGAVSITVQLQLGVNGPNYSIPALIPVSGLWTFPGFILGRAQQVWANFSVASLVGYEVRWRHYYGRQE